MVFERPGVAAAAVDEVQHVARFVEAGEAGGQRIFHADFQKILPAAFAVGLEEYFAAIVGHFDGEAHFVIFVDHEAGELGFF